MPAQLSSTKHQSRMFMPSPYSGTLRPSSRLVTNSGMTFSGYWYGPKLLDERVMRTGSSYVVKYDSAMRSEPALDAEYGQRRPSRSSSVNEPAGIRTCT